MCMLSLKLCFVLLPKPKNVICLSNLLPRLFRGQWKRSQDDLKAVPPHGFVLRCRQCHKYLVMALLEK